MRNPAACSGGWRITWKPTRRAPGDFKAHYKPTRRQQRRIKRRERAAARRGRHGARPAQEEPQHETQ